MLTNLEPQRPKNGKNGKSTKHRKTRDFLAGGSLRRQAVQPLSPTGRRELPYGNATARPEFKRLRATAGQGPNYVGPSCGDVGLCWPILRTMLAQLGAMLSQLGAMLAFLEGYVGRS